ncbi:MAG: outer membrane beta-barrel protein [Candidatus Doudnabacteria bacterium]|nr:outer membrane beta-barrel protein [Candidatus Omnitrophota bacterium]MDZ4243986.1 outer membrane beta-barrel protein [Candidatus Doudnabacteria bacterium]
MSNLKFAGKWKALALATAVLSICVLPAGAAINLNETQGGTVTEWEIGPEISYIKYEEPDVMEEKGVMGGVFGTYTVRLPQKVVLGVDGRFSYGQVDYDSVSTGSIDNISDFILEGRGYVGYDIAASANTRLTPYIGLGYRFLRDQLGGEVSTTGALGYDRESNYFYLPVGVKTLTALDNGWFLGFTVEYDAFLDGKQKSELGDAIAGIDTVENNQDEGYGMRGSVQIVKTMEQYDIFVEPFVRYWNIKQSDLQAVTFNGTPIGVVGYEPKNNSTEYGVKLGMHF